MALTRTDGDITQFPCCKDLHYETNNILSKNVWYSCCFTTHSGHWPYMKDWVQEIEVPKHLFEWTSFLDSKLYPNSKFGFVEFFFSAKTDTFWQGSGTTTAPLHLSHDLDSDPSGNSLGPNIKTSLPFIPRDWPMSRFLWSWTLR